ncbi:MAG: hypothetical protein JNN01_06385 [Opitutaceae bacterium]|nr:hypothetical protein [Opitutaceae bacterium]
MRALIALTSLLVMNTAIAGIGDSLESAKKKYGAVVEVSTYRPDLYPTSYIFQSAGAKIEVTPLPRAISRLDVFYASLPSEPVEGLLERYSGRSGWKSRPLAEPEFAREFPLFSTTTSKNRFFVADGVFALVQSDVGDHKLVIAIQSADYLAELHEYRKKKKGA